MPDAYGSPYQSESAFALNPLFLDLDLLCAEGLLKPEECAAAALPDCKAVPYARLFRERLPLLQKAGERCCAQRRDAVEAFASAHPRCTAYARFCGSPDTACAMQYLTFLQWCALKRHAGERGVSILGDVPMYVSAQSADVRENPAQFKLCADGQPAAVAGVPPDDFCADGQRWGNPLYDWEAMAQDGFAWWRARITWASELFDGVRLDHFRAFSRYWAIRPDCPTARSGHWENGAGLPLLQAFRQDCPDLFFVAEDLGLLDDAVHTLRRAAGFSGTAVLQFAFSPGSPYLPHKLTRDRVCYTGTHDNPPLAAWCADLRYAREQTFAAQYLGVARERLAEAILRAGMASVSDLFIAPMGDFLAAAERINTPAALEGNWQWRIGENDLTDTLAARIRTLTALYGRIAG